MKVKKFCYETPEIEILKIEVEKGFASSGGSLRRFFPWSGAKEEDASLPDSIIWPEWKDGGELGVN